MARISIALKGIFLRSDNPSCISVHNFYKSENISVIDEDDTLKSTISALTPRHMMYI